MKYFLLTRSTAIFIFFLILCVLFWSLDGLTSDLDVYRTLALDGYTEIEVGGYSWFGCGRDDIFRTSFRATKNGEQLTYSPT